jgi:hypothetical protein
VPVIAPTSTNRHVQGGNALIDIIHRKYTSVGILFPRDMAFVGLLIQDAMQVGSYAGVELLRNDCTSSYENSWSVKIADRLLRQIIMWDPRRVTTVWASTAC